jgi:hypothetical protein
MTAPSSYQASPHDGRTETETGITGLDVLTEWAEGVKPRRHREGVFAANYPGTCASCAGRITPGDEVLYGLDDSLEHGTCLDDLDTIPAQGVCDGCYLTRAVNGSCGCA